MSEEVIVKYCSPTLAGLKTGSLFSCSYDNQNELLDFLRELNLSLGDKGIRFLPLRLRNNKALIYVYTQTLHLLRFVYRNCRNGVRSRSWLRRMQGDGTLKFDDIYWWFRE